MLSNYFFCLLHFTTVIIFIILFILDSVISAKCNCININRLLRDVRGYNFVFISSINTVKSSTKCSYLSYTKFKNVYDSIKWCKCRLTHKMETRWTFFRVRYVFECEFEISWTLVQKLRIPIISYAMYSILFYYYFMGRFPFKCHHFELLFKRFLLHSM